MNRIVLMILLVFLFAILSLFDGTGAQGVCVHQGRQYRNGEEWVWEIFVKVEKNDNSARPQLLYHEVLRLPQPMGDTGNKLMIFKGNICNIHLHKILRLIFHKNKKCIKIFFEFATGCWLHFVDERSNPGERPNPRLPRRVEVRAGSRREHATRPADGILKKERGINTDLILMG